MAYGAAMRKRILQLKALPAVGISDFLN